MSPRLLERCAALQDAVAVLILRLSSEGRSPSQGPVSAGPTGEQSADVLYVCIQDDAKIAIVDMATKAIPDD